MVLQKLLEMKEDGVVKISLDEARTHAESLGIGRDDDPDASDPLRPSDYSGVSLDAPAEDPDSVDHLASLRHAERRFLQLHPRAPAPVAAAAARADAAAESGDVAGAEAALPAAISTITTALATGVVPHSLRRPRVWPLFAGRRRRSWLVWRPGLEQCHAHG